MFKKIMLLIKYGDELEALLKKEAKAKHEVDRQARNHNLNLCFAHRQEWKRSQYAPQPAPPPPAPQAPPVPVQRSSSRAYHNQPQVGPTKKAILKAQSFGIGAIPANPSPAMLEIKRLEELIVNFYLQHDETALQYKMSSAKAVYAEGAALYNRNTSD